MGIKDIPLKSLDGTPTSLGAHTDRAVIAVNVASKFGLTPQYIALDELHKTYSGQGFSVVGFPCNQFGGQEPGTAEEIQTFCSRPYGVTFPMTEKIGVYGPRGPP